MWIKKLTDKQKLFCIFHLQSFNATQAYLKAYGGSKKVAGAKISDFVNFGNIGVENNQGRYFNQT